MSKYTDNLRKIKSLLIVTSIQKKQDIKSFKYLRKLNISLNWNPLSHYMIDGEIWHYVVDERKYDPKLVFCHPEVIKVKTSTSLYYRGLSGLSMKAAKEYIGTIEKFERIHGVTKINDDKALKMAQTYNTFICSNISGSSDWTLENGKRTIIATLGITIDGIMRNKIGEIAEERVRTLIIEYLINHQLIQSPKIVPSKELETLPDKFMLTNEIIMKFSSEPDISFFKEIKGNEKLLAVIEIKGGIDPAGALERYGAATKSFQHALKTSSKCKNFFLSAVYTNELNNRIQNDRLVEKFYDIIQILEDAKVRKDFFQELFHYTLRMS